MKVKEESEKVDLKFNIQKTKIMASGPITLWQIDGETMETATDFIFLPRALVGQGTHLSERVQSLVPLGTHDLNTLMSLGGSEKRYKHFCYVLKTHVWTFQEPLSLVTTVPPRTTHSFL